MVQFVEVRGGQVAYEERGGDAGVPILWLQGLGADHTAWGVQLNHFSRTHRCIAPDNRDAGATTVPTSSAPGEGGDYTIAEMAEDAVGLLDGLQIRRAHVVGLSMGASIAQEIALGWGDRVAGLVLASSFAGPRPRLTALLEAWAAIYAAVERETFYRQAAAWMFSDRYFENPRNLHALLSYVRRSAAPQAPEAFARQARASVGHNTLERLTKIAVPTLVIGGTEDILVPPAWQAELAAGIPGARYTLLEAVGHSVNLEAQSVFNTTVREFLEEAEAP